MGRGRQLAQAQRQPRRILIPDLTGMIMAAALRQADEVGFTLLVGDPPAALTELLTSGRWVVVSQDPPAFSQRYRGDTVVVSLRRESGGGEAGDREPRTPLPRRRSGRALSPADLEEPIEQPPPIGSVHPLNPVATRVEVDRDRPVR